MSERARGRSAEGRLAEVSRWATFGLVAGVIGTTALAFAVVLYILEPRLLPLSGANAGVGAAGIILYALTNRASLGRAFTGRSTPLLLLESVIIAGVVGALIGLNYLAAQQGKEWDLTRDGLYTLLPQSQQVCERLEAPVTVYAFFQNDDKRRDQLVEQLRLYRQHTDAIALEFVDPDRAPAVLVERFEMSSKSPKIVFATEQRHTKIERPSEQEITNALLALTERPVRTMGWVDGHGGRDWSDKKAEEAYGEAAAALRDEGFRLQRIDLSQPIPDQVELIALVSPRIELLANEAAALDAFGDQGGRILLLLDPVTPIESLRPLMDESGIDVGNNVVIDVDPATKTIGFEADTAVLRDYESHPITRALRGQPTLFYRTRAVQPALGALTVSTLLQSSDQSWAEADPLAPKPWALDVDDAPGPVPFAVAMDAGVDGPPDQLAQASRWVVFGDADFASNKLIAVGANRDLFLNAVSWLLGEEDRVTLRPKRRAGDRLAITELQHYGIMFFSVNLMPLIIIGVGFSVWAVRRRR